MNNIKNAIEKTKLFVCDMDGTVYLGDKPLDGAVEFVEAVKKSGKRLVFFTNNASRAKNEYIAKLSKLGFGSCEVLTAGDVAISYLNTYRKGKTVYPVCTASLLKDLVENGLNIVDTPNADIVLSSFDTELTYNKLCIACDAIRAGAEYFCTHPDYNCPIENGWLPDSGAIAALITASTNVKPTYFGKPYASAANMILEITGVCREEVMCIGDRLYTDIALGKSAGMMSLLVLSGESKAEDVTDNNKPDFILNSVKDLINYM